MVLRPLRSVVIAVAVAASGLIAAATTHADNPPGCLDIVYSWAPYYGGPFSATTNLVSGELVAVAQNTTILIVELGASFAVEVGRLRLGSTIRDMTACGDVLLVAHEHGLTLVDVTHQAAPRELSIRSLPTGAWAVACSGHRSLVAERGVAVHLLDVRDSRDPVWLDSRPLWVWNVAVHGPIALATHTRGIEHYDISGDALEPIRTIQFADGSSSGVEIWAGRAFAVSGSTLYSWWLDVSNPRAETQVTRNYSLPDAGWGWTLGGGLALFEGLHCGFAQCTFYGVYVFDLSDPLQPATITKVAPSLPNLISGDRALDVYNGINVRDLGACVAETPEARLLWWPLTPAAGETVHFEDASTHVPSSWSWSFGDGATSTEQNPVHTYAWTGRHEVSLTVSSQLGTDSLSQTVIIREAVRRPRGRVGR